MILAAIRAFSVGRDAKNDVVIKEPSVARMHCELVFARDERYYITDCGSINGTKLARHGQWLSIQQEYVGPRDVLLLGNYQTSVGALIERIPFATITDGKGKPRRSADPEPTPSVIQAVRRDPGTGDIIHGD